jgi:diaminopimelate decarboxylase
MMNDAQARAFRSFAIIQGELCINGIRLSHLALRVGQTPFYAYDRSMLRTRLTQLRRALPEQIAIHYAIKANPMPALVGFMSDLVDGLDVASGAEMRVALDAGMSPGQISFAGPGKSASELTQAVAAGILVNAESPRELQLLHEISERLRIPARVAVRVNPGFELKSSGMKMGGGPKQFGIDAEQVPSALDEIARLGLVFEGFHIFSGSQNLRVDAICEAQSKSLALAVELAATAPGPVKSVNLGGGFGIPYFPGEQPIDIEPIGRHLAELAAQAGSKLPGAQLVIELGRYLVGEAGVYVCRVVDRKQSRGETFLVTDGGLHHHLAASGNFGQVIRKNYPVAIGTCMDDARPLRRTSVVGPLCTPLDTLAERMDLPEAEPGDLVVVFQSGAYGLTASPHRFLSHPEALEVLV